MAQYNLHHDCPSCKLCRQHLTLLRAVASDYKSSQKLPKFRYGSTQIGPVSAREELLEAVRPLLRHALSKGVSSSQGGIHRDMGVSQIRVPF